ncbi:MAG: hypothetical protein P8178_01625 [Candidatus Thiodiazotropha sp.]
MSDGDVAHKPIPGQASVIDHRDYNFKKTDLNLRTGYDAELDTHLELYDYRAGTMTDENVKTFLPCFHGNVIKDDRAEQMDGRE